MTQRERWSKRIELFYASIWSWDWKAWKRTWDLVGGGVLGSCWSRVGSPTWRQVRDQGELCIRERLEMAYV